MLFATAYSGAGFFEAATAHLADNLRSAGHGVRLQCWAARENDRVRRDILVRHRGPAAPQHVHGDLAMRFSGRAISKMERIREAFAKDTQSYIDQGMDHQRAVKQIGLGMIDAIDAVLRSAQPVAATHCYKCSTPWRAATCFHYPTAEELAASFAGMDDHPHGRGDV